MAKNIKIAVKNNYAALLDSVTLVAGTIGQVCKLYFYSPWENLKKQISYKVGNTILGPYDLPTDEVAVPANVFLTAGLPLEIGITGYSEDKTIVIPTIWCLIGPIKNGTIPSHNNNDDDTQHIIYDGGMIV